MIKMPSGTLMEVLDYLADNVAPIEQELVETNEVGARVKAMMDRVWFKCGAPNQHSAGDWQVLILDHKIMVETQPESFELLLILKYGASIMRCR